MLKSGIHATITGVILACSFPCGGRLGWVFPAPRALAIPALHVVYWILPLFAFANAGISMGGVRLASLHHPLPLGIAAGFFIGKQAGVFLFSYLAIKLGLAQPLESVGWKVFYGIAVLCGIGFTMSLFISSLAFEPGSLGESVDERIGIIAGSFLSAIIGYTVLRSSLSDASA